MSRSRHSVLGAAGWIVVAGSLAYHLLRVVQSCKPLDDAYMYVRYAINLLEGHGYAWNPGGPQTFGAVSLPFTGLVTLAKAVFPSASSSALLCGVTGVLGVLCLAAAAWMFRRLAGSAWWVVVVPYLAFNPWFTFHASRGMDTLLSFLANTLLVLVVVRAAQTVSARAIFVAAMSGYFCYLVRPDNAFFAGLFPMLFLLLAGLGWKAAVRYVAYLGGWVVLDTALKWWLFGHPLPLPSLVKQLGGYADYQGASQWNPYGYLLGFAIMASPALLLFVLFAGRRTLRLSIAVFAPLLITFASYFGIHQIMGTGARYYFPALPFLIALAAWTMRDASWRLRPRRVVLAVVLAVAAGGILVPRRDAYVRSHLAAWEGQRLPVSSVTPEERLAHDAMWNDWLARLPEGTTITGSEHGQVAADHPQLTIIDLVGLHDPTIAHHGFSADYVMGRSPDVVWFPHAHYAQITRDLLAHPTFLAEYRFPDDDPSTRLAIRRSADELWRLFEEAADRHFPDRVAAEPREELAPHCWSRML